MSCACKAIGVRPVSTKRACAGGHPLAQSADGRASGVVPAVALVEGTNVSVGRGTAHPFEVMGAPWMDAERPLAALQDYSLAGVSFSTVRFKPNASWYAGKDWSGVSLRVTDRTQFEPVRTELPWPSACAASTPHDGRRGACTKSLASPR